MDDIEREAIRAEGLDADDPEVIKAIDIVRWELSLAAESPCYPCSASRSAEIHKQTKQTFTVRDRTGEAW